MFEHELQAAARGARAHAPLAGWLSSPAAEVPAHGFHIATSCSHAEADRKAVGTRGMLQTGMAATSQLRVRRAEPCAQFVLFRGTTRERASSLNKQGNVKKKGGYYYF